MKPDDGILIIDDEVAALKACRLALRAAGLGPIHGCEDPKKALAWARENAPALVLLDISMPGMSGETMLELLKEELAHLPVIMITAYNDVETAVRCMRAGAFDYLTKPLNKDRLITTVRRALNAKALAVENLRLKKQLLKHEHFDQEAFSDIVTQDERMHAIFRYTSAIAASSEPVLITGETGVGKDLMARAIHSLSERAGQFVALNTAGLEEQMFSDVLFGHAKGAYTGAHGPREGLLRKAEGGTLFLDEIGDVSLPLQSRLLRVIESGEYYAGGSDRLLRSNARIVVATHRDVHKLCEEGCMRRDLFYRLDVHHIHLPPLRERTGDIALLAAAFVNTAAKTLQRPPPQLTPATLRALESYPWPGNVRELRAVITDIVSTAGQTISPERITDKLAIDSSVVNTAPVFENPDNGKFPTIREATDALIQRAMRETGGNQSQAAQLLGISQPALSKRLKK